MPVTSLRFGNLGPFDEVSFQFDQQINVFAGPNNSGKSTALWALAEIVVYPFQFSHKSYRKVDVEFEIRAKFGRRTRTLAGEFPIATSDKFWNEEKWKEAVELLVDLGYTNYLPALRRSTNFRSPGPSSEKEAPSPQRRRVLSQYPRLIQEQAKREALFSTDEMLVSDEVVVQKMIDLDYRAYRLRQPSVRSLIDTITSVTSDITDGFRLKFTGIGEDDHGLFPQFESPDGKVALNVLSQGTQSIIQWVAHFIMGYAQYYDYPRALEKKPAILIIDEIDAHLHPSWQRRIIPTLISHFPKLQIFCSSHSPLMLAGLKEGQVQLLKRDENGKVTVSRNETDIVGWSADEILRNYLDVQSPTDLGTVGHIERLQELRRKDTLSDEETAELEQLRHTVNQDLMGGSAASQVERMSELLKQAAPPSPAQPQPPTPSRRRASRRDRRPSK